MRRKIARAALCSWMAVMGGWAAATDTLVAVQLRDGSRLVGRVVAEDAASLTVATSDGLRVVVPRASIVSTTAVGGDGRSVSVDPNYSRLMFAPTARPLARGDGYFSSYELLFPGVAYGVTDNLSLAGGVSVIPGIGLGEQLFYISPKVGFELSERASVAVGGLFTGFGGDDGGEGDAAYIGFAVGTFGGPKSSVTLGFGLGDTTDEFSDAVPIVMAGGTLPLSRRTALVGETWMFLNDDFRLSEQPVGLAVRFFGDRLSADVGVILVGELLDEGFPIPWLSVTYHFGKSRDALPASAARMPGKVLMPRGAR
jgi:hypothetical protein